MGSIVIVLCFLSFLHEGELKDERLKVANEIAIDVSSGLKTYHVRTSFPGRSVTPFHAHSIPSDASFLLFQAHAQNVPVTISYSADTPPDKTESDTGTNTGLVVVLKAWDTDATTFIHNPSVDNVTLLLVVSLHGSKDPVPGGCNMEFPVEVSPFLRLVLKSTELAVEFQHASSGVPREAQTSKCSRSLPLFRYDLYVYYLDQWDLSEDHYLTAVSKMLDPSSVKSNAHLVKAYRENPKTRALFLTYPGEGAVYSVLVEQVTWDGQIHEAAYVPIATYGCLWYTQSETCRRLESAWGLVVALLLSIAGLIICFRGHRFFSFQMFFFGFLAFSLISFMVFIAITRASARDGLLAALLGGALGGLLWMAIWWLFAIPVLSISLSGLFLGFLVAAVLLFTPLGEVAFLQSSLSYWVFVSCIMLLPTVLLLPQARLLSVLSCCLVGGYCTILAADQYLGTSLSYVVLNVVRRSLVPGGYQASNTVPFQLNDLLLSLTWAALFVLGTVLQLWSERGRAPFPQSPYHKWIRDRSSAGQPLLATTPQVPPPAYGSIGSTAPPYDPPPSYGTF
ncbi:transmembrane 7 superfamily member 3 [Dermacentor silvarum]|uniref:transmembrane 7 superfamily member 3 n=1 Tax=Dermacentor silvarum TaxID=543639 RepID=UPI001899EFF1|nr:transmembrane 7 superfamily member 3 [Dermacentor silvarum]